MSAQESRRRVERIRINYRRKRISKKELSLDWALANVYLTERKQIILDLLELRRMMTVEQILYHHLGFGHQERARALLQRDLNKLHEVYLIDKAYKPVQMWDGTVSKTEIVAMGELGSQYVRWKFHSERIKHQNGEVILPQTTHHTLQIHNMEIATIEALKELNIEVKLWIPECRWKVVNHPNGLNPDAFCLMYDLETQKYYTIFAEYDTGNDDIGRTKNFPRLAEKFNKYRQVKEWEDWYDKAVSRASENKFPHVFFVTEDPKRFPRIPEILSERGIEHTSCMREDYMEQLKSFILRLRTAEAVGFLGS